MRVVRKHDRLVEDLLGFRVAALGNQIVGEIVISEALLRIELNHLTIQFDGLATVAQIGQDGAKIEITISELRLESDGLAKDLGRFARFSLLTQDQSQINRG